MYRQEQMAALKARLLFVEHQEHVLLYAYDAVTHQFVASKLMHNFRVKQQKEMTKQVVLGLQAAIGSTTRVYFESDVISALVDRHQVDIAAATSFLIEKLKNPIPNLSFSKTVTLRNALVFLNVNGQCDFEFVLTQQMIESAMFALAFTFSRRFNTLVRNMKGRSIVEINNPADNIFRLPIFLKEMQRPFEQHIAFVSVMPEIRLFNRAEYQLKEMLADRAQNARTRAAAASPEAIAMARVAAMAREAAASSGDEASGDEAH